MHRMLLILLGVMLLGTWLGSLMYHDSGYVLISWSNTTLEMSVWVLLLLILIAGLLSYFLMWLLFSIKTPWVYFNRWTISNRLRSQQNQLHQGLLALASGYYQHAEKRLVMLAKQDIMLVVIKPSLAQALARQGRMDEAQSLLQQLANQHPKTTSLTLLKRAELYLQSGNDMAALPLLKKILQSDKTHADANQHLLGVLQRLQYWQDLIVLLMQLDRSKQLPTNQLAAQQSLAYDQAISNWDIQEGLTALQRFWRNAPNHVIQEPLLRKKYAKALQYTELANGHHGITERFIQSALQKQWQDDLVLLYANLPLVNVQKSLTVAEAWQKQAPASAALQLALGRLCRQLQLWGKACDYLRASLALQTDREVQLELAALLDQMGETQQSLNYFRAASGEAGTTSVI
jgi:HemY protein